MRLRGCRLHSGLSRRLRHDALVAERQSPVEKRLCGRTIARRRAAARSRAGGTTCASRSSRSASGRSMRSSPSQCRQSNDEQRQRHRRPCARRRRACGRTGASCPGTAGRGLPAVSASTSPSRIAARAGNAAMALSISGTLAVTSRPVRENTRTPMWPLWICTRAPSSLYSSTASRRARRARCRRPWPGSRASAPAARTASA